MYMTISFGSVFSSRSALVNDSAVWNCFQVMKITDVAVKLSLINVTRGNTVFQVLEINSLTPVVRYEPVTRCSASKLSGAEWNTWSIVISFLEKSSVLKTTRGW